MSAVVHVKSNTIGDMTGTVTVFNSAGATTTAAATDLVRPGDWNSAHQFTQTISGNTAGQSTASGTNFVIGGTNGVTASLSTAAGAATLWLSAAGGGGGAPDRRYKEIVQGERFTTCLNFSQTNISNRILLFPFWMEGTGIALNTVRFMVTGIASSNRSLGGTYQAALYSQNNDTRLTLLTSDSMAFSITASSQSTVWNGYRALDFTRMSGFTVTAEGRHVLGLLISNVSNDATWANVGLYGGDNQPAFSGGLSYGTSSATTSNSQILPFWGGYNTTTGAFPASIAQTQVNGELSASLYDVYAIIKEI
jgi:hypothetical protein